MCVTEKQELVVRPCSSGFVEVRLGLPWSVSDLLFKLALQGGCLDVHPCFGSIIHASPETVDGARMEQHKKYISDLVPSTSHACFSDVALDITIRFVSSR